MATCATARNSFDENKFTGTPANFVHKKGDWVTHDSGTSICRHLFFKSTVPESAVLSFSLMGGRCRSVSFTVALNPELSFPEVVEIERYLGEGISVNFEKWMYTRNNAQFRRVYSFLTEDNTLVAGRYSSVIKSYQLNAELSTDEVKLEGGYTPAPSRDVKLKIDPSTDKSRLLWDKMGLDEDWELSCSLEALCEGGTE